MSRRPTLQRLGSLIDALPRSRVSVVGDAVLDEFHYGEIARVSREAPVLILNHKRTEWVPGGAANTSANLAALDVRVALIGRVGGDDHGERLRTLLDERGVDTRGLVTDRLYETPTKSRILAGSPHTAKQQIVRIDRGHRIVPLSANALKRHLARVLKARARGEGLILADYGYGTVSPRWVDELGPGGGPVTLDSRFQLESYRGVDAATPNLEELERTLGVRIEDGDEPALVEAASRLRRRLGAPALLVTKGSRGMTLVEQRARPTEIPVFGSDEIADVTGAGDTVIAVFTAARAAGGTWREAAELANVAGGLVVMKRGTATVSRDEMRAALEEAWE